jgi:hypothetical protein
VPCTRRGWFGCAEDVGEVVGPVWLAFPPLALCAAVPHPLRTTIATRDKIATNWDILRLIFLTLQRTEIIAADPGLQKRAVIRALTCGYAVPSAGFEPAAHGLGNRCSIP